MYLTSKYYKIPSLFTIPFLSQIETHLVKINNNIMIIETLKLMIQRHGYLGRRRVKIIFDLRV
jgi:hypothetical protein